MTSSSRGIEVVKKFGSNFELWKLKMKDMLIDQDLWDSTDANLSRLSNPIVVAQYYVMDHKVKGLIWLCLTNFILNNVHEETLVQSWKEIPQRE